MADLIKCPINLANSIVREFVASVKIAVGFTIDETNAYPYEISLSIDKSSVKYIVRESTFPSVITVPSFRENEEEAQMECRSRMRVLRFEGPLFYNCVVSGFVPNSALEGIINGDTELALVNQAKFATADTVLMADTIGYACYECIIPDDLVDGFNVEIKQQPEFIINNQGNRINHKPESETTFFEELKGLETQVIHIPYTLTLTPKVKNDEDSEEDSKEDSEVTP